MTQTDAKITELAVRLTVLERERAEIVLPSPLCLESDMDISSEGIIMEEQASAAIPPGEIAKLLFANQQESEVFLRHYEDVRFKITQVTVTLAGLLIGATRFGPLRTAPVANLPISFFIVVLGIIGVLISAKYSERADRHAVLARAYRKAASALVGKVHGRELEEIHQQAAAQHSASAGLMSRIRVRYFWIAVHLCVVVLGITVAFI
jgi:hypothetical protein